MHIHSENNQPTILDGLLNSGEYSVLVIQTQRQVDELTVRIRV